MISKQVVWVTHQFVGFHKWPDAPEVVGYLRHIHRHLFKVRADVEVSHLNRDVEFHILKNDLIEVCNNHISKADEHTQWSCEDIAKYIMYELHIRSRKYKMVSVSVSEDGECGATLYT